MLAINKNTDFVIDLVNKSLKIEDRIIHHPHPDYHDRRATLKCPCCNQGFWVIFNCSYDGTINYADKHIKNKDASKRLLNHIEYCVRMKGSIRHCNFLVKTFGKKEAVKIIKKFARQNINIAKNINCYLEKLNKI